MNSEEAKDMSRVHGYGKHSSHVSVGNCYLNQKFILTDEKGVNGLTNNLVDKIASTVTVWCSDGNAMENRMLMTIDTFGVVVSGWNPALGLAVFVPWNQIKYIDYPMT